MNPEKKSRKNDLSDRFYLHHKCQTQLEPGDQILLALSGGKDSVCLFHLLLENRKKLGYDFAACHIHHGIRGQEADRDWDFCRKLCEKSQIPFFEKKIDVPSFCEKEKIGLEEGARILRYQVLKNLAEKNGFTKIATAHTASDQAETVLFRLIRGTGFAGCNGILASQGILIRPLLSFYTKEITDFLTERRLSFVTDSSNHSLMFSRNRIRKQILPAIKKINPAAEKAIGRFSRQAGEMDLLCEKLCDRFEKFHKISLKDGKAPIFALQELSSDPAGFPILYRALTRMTKNGTSIDAERFYAVITLLNQKTSGKIIEIKKNAYFLRQGENLIFLTETKKPDAPNYEIRLQTGSNTIPALPGTLFLSQPTPGNAENIYKKNLIIHIALDKIDGVIFSRNYHSGDTIVMGNIKRNVKKLLSDYKIPLELRKKIPFVCDAQGILWIPGIGLDDRARPERAAWHQTFHLQFDTPKNTLF